MGLSMYHDTGAKLRVISDSGVAPVRLSTSTNNATRTGSAVERRPTASVRQHYESAVLVVQMKASSLTAANHGRIIAKLQHSNATGSGWVDYDDRLDASGDLEFTADGDQLVTQSANYRLATARRYIRVHMIVRHAADSAPGTATNLPSGDTIEASAVLVMCGSDQTPADVATADLGPVTGNQAVAQMGQ